MKRKPKKCFSVDELIKALEKLKKDSPFGGDTAVCVCDQGVPYRGIYKVKNDRDPDGCVTLLFAED